MFAHAITGALGSGKRHMAAVIAVTLVFALCIACLFLVAAGAGGMAIAAGVAIGEAVGPFFAAVLLLAMAVCGRPALRRADALACRVLS